MIFFCLIIHLDCFGACLSFRGIDLRFLPRVTELDCTRLVALKAPTKYISKETQQRCLFQEIMTSLWALSCRNYFSFYQTSAYNFLIIAGQSYEIRMLDNRKIGELPEITGKMVKVRFGLTEFHCLLGQTLKALASALVYRKNEFLWISEHHPCGVSRPTTSVHRAPTAGGLALEQAWGSHPRPGWVYFSRLHMLLVPVYCPGLVGGKNVAAQPRIYIDPHIDFGWILFRILTVNLNCKYKA